MLLLELFKLGEAGANPERNSAIALKARLQRHEKWGGEMTIDAGLPIAGQHDRNHVSFTNEPSFGARTP